MSLQPVPHQVTALAGIGRGLSSLVWVQLPDACGTRVAGQVAGLHARAGELIAPRGYRRLPICRARRAREPRGLVGLADGTRQVPPGCRGERNCDD